MKKKQVSKNDPQFIKDLNDALSALTIFSKFKNEYGFDLLRNLKYREYIIEQSINKYDPSYNTVSDKIDFKSALSQNGEVKSGNFKGYKGTKFEFDKQNDSARREKTLLYDGFAFGVFDPKDATSLLYVLYAQNKVSVNHINELIKSKQKEFVLKMVESEKNNKQISRDVIQLNLNEIIATPEIICLNCNGKVVDLKSLFVAA